MRVPVREHRIHGNAPAGREVTTIINTTRKDAEELEIREIYDTLHYELFVEVHNVPVSSEGDPMHTWMYSIHEIISSALPDPVIVIFPRTGLLRPHVELAASIRTQEAAAWNEKNIRFVYES